MPIFNDWEEVINGIYPDVIIADASGNIVYASENTEYWFGLSREKMIGLSVFDLERQGIFQPSITRKVIETGRKQTLVQTTRTGKKLLVTGNMIFDHQQNMKYIICYAQDITELEYLREYVAKMEAEMEKLQSELLELQGAMEHYSGIIAKSDKMKDILSTLDRIAKTDASILLTGESGVGKTFLAKFVHERSGRKGNFVVVNCSSIPESLFESELFGYAPGAFTGGSKYGKGGLVEEAHHGTLFLDEIGDLPYSLQSKLLTLIQEKKFYRLGDPKPKSVDFRLITATNVNIEEMVRQKMFREDLYFRISVIHTTIPPLRERQDDLLALIMTYLQKFNRLYRVHKELSPSTIQTLLNYPWPGNVRELGNVMERLVLTVDETIISPDHLPSKMVPRQSSPPLSGIGEKSLYELMRETEINILREAWQRCGSTTKMARYLRISQPTVVRKLHKYRGLIHT